jgi:exopolyphosphatase / guanosine-5'-triphosphate,3'-diphosphate pyrophosphatase
MGDARGVLRVGAIDVGSNSIRLLVADVSPDPAVDLVTVVRAGEHCRLGRGLHSTGLIEAAAAERAAGLVLEFVRRAQNLGARPPLIGATAALREALNGAEVAERIAARCGLTVRILSGGEEARLVYEAVVLGLGSPARNSSCLVFDLGGGSTEVVSGVGPHPGRWQSLPFGAVSLTERFLGGNPPSAGEVEALESYVDGELAARCSEMPDSTPLLAGVGGTVTGLGVLDRGLSTYTPSLVEGWMVEMSRLEALVERLRSSTEAERRRLSGLGTGRADIVVAGALAVRRLARRFQARGMVCSTRGLRYGLARLAAAGAWEGNSSSPGTASERFPG